jgi:Domain of unknown function (DUF6457)
MTTLDQWAGSAAAELGVEAPDSETQRLVLDVAREVAHNVLRPGAPLSTFLLGLAVGRGAPLDSAAAAMVALARRGTVAPDSSP